jgi:hypothetical protein
MIKQSQTLKTKTAIDYDLLRGLNAIPVQTGVQRKRRGEIIF